METPTLNKNQQKSALSSKKARTKETIKNVLASPYSQYWPLINPDDYDSLKQVLEQNLPIISVKIPWKNFKGAEKSDYKKIRKEYVQRNKEISNKKGLIVGVNKVTRLLEQNAISALLISSDVNPKLMVQHVLDQAVLYKVPVIIFNDLRKLLKEVCGVGSVVIGISKDLDQDSKFNLIREAIAQCYENCPSPVNHINYNRSLDSEESVKKITTHVEPKRDDILTEDEIRQIIYLKREDKTKRVFIPVYSDNVTRQDKMEVDSEGFLPFSQEPVPTVSSTIKLSYKSLVVKRLRSDPMRSKKKIATLKKKN